MYFIWSTWTTTKHQASRLHCRNDYMWHNNTFNNNNLQKCAKKKEFFLFLVIPTMAHSSITFVTKKSGKFHFWMATAPGTNMLSTNFWLIIVHPVRVKTYRSLKIKFFVKVKNKVHVTIGHVCDFARNYGPAQNDFKVKILWCVMEFCIEQYTDDGQHIYKQFHIIRIKFYRQDFFWCNIFVWSRLWHLGVTFGSRLWHFWCRSCAHSCTDRKASQFDFGNTSQVPNNKLMT